MRVTIVPCLLAATLACSRTPPPEAAKAAPATIDHPATEASLTTVTLTAEAVRRLGVETVAAGVERIHGTRTVGGEVLVPEGRSVVVSAPVAGTLVAAGTARPGARVARGDVLFRLVPLVSSDREQGIESQRAAAAAEAEDQQARQRLARVEQLLAEGATSVRAVEEARAQREVAAAALRAARERVKGATRTAVTAGGDIVITAPLAGVLQTVSAAQGQTVAAATPLFQIAQLDTLWVRVPLYAGDAAMIDMSQPASVSSLGASGAPRAARRVAAPPRADPGAASVDLFFELEPGETRLQPGERVTVQLVLTGAAEGLAVPQSALVYDIHGATWVYEDLGSGAFARRRVEVARQVGDRAVIARGISAGTRVVTVGAAELFGTEFGAGK